MRRTLRRTLGVLLASTAILASVVGAHAQLDRYIVDKFIENGRVIEEIIVPGRPPAIKPEAAFLPEPNTAMGTNSLTNMPAFTWCYGCSATSAAMIAGYYDNHGYSNMYAGPANGGVCPMNNDSYWTYTGTPPGSSGECPLSATHMGFDGRATRGHVDDYWIDYLNTGPDPYIVNSWPEHTWSDCTADFMGTSQSKFNSKKDGATSFYYYDDGTPLYDYSGCEPGNRGGCHGFRQFFESRGYTVLTNFNQKIYGWEGNTNGYTFADYKADIDAGAPVMIHVEGHTMVGFGYNDTGTVVYLRNTGTLRGIRIPFGCPPRSHGGRDLAR